MTGSNGLDPPVAHFSHLRLRSLAGRLESGFDPKAQVSNAMSLALALPPVRCSSSPNARELGSPCSPAGRAESFRHSDTTAAQASSPRPEELASCSGRCSPPDGSSTRKQARSPHRSTTGRAQQSATVDSALAEITALRSQIFGVETVLSYLGSQNDGVNMSFMGSSKAPRAQTLRQLRSGTSLPEAAVGKVRRSSTLTSECDSQSNVSDSGFNSLMGPQMFGAKSGRSWRQSPAVVPVGRGEAVILSAALDETMPPGALTGKYSQHQARRATGPHDIARQSAASFLVHQDMRRDFQTIDMVQAEAARQVSASCFERGDLIDKVRQRYEELFAALSHLSSHLLEANVTLSHDLTAAETFAADHRRKAELLQVTLSERDAEIEALHDTVATKSSAFEASQWEMQQRIDQLTGQNDILAGHVEAFQVKLEEAAAGKEQALEEGLAGLEDQLDKVADERDDLLQRIRFLERQVVRLRQDANFAIPTNSVEVQTDEVEFGVQQDLGPSSDVDDDDEEAAALLQQRLHALLHGQDTKPAATKSKKHKLRFLGHFQGAIQTRRAGRVRGIAWTHTCISQLYYDKIIADTVADREGNARAELHDFTYDWHITRFGLRPLAELHLLDLLASVRQHYKSSQRINWFAQFVGLVEASPRVDTLPHVSYYVLCLQQLAYPNALAVLFPETDELPVMLRAPVVLDAVRAMFRYLNDADGALPFLSRLVDPITDDSVDPAIIPCDELMRLLMAEFQKRIDRNISHLRSLFRAGDLDDDGCITYDEFCALVRHAAPDVKERAVTRMYAEALRALPDNATMVDCDTFVATCRCFGFDRWKIELPSAGGTGSMSRPVSAAYSLQRDAFTSGLGNAQGTKNLSKMLETALSTLDSPLEEQVKSACDKCSLDGRKEMAVLIQAQADKFQSVYQAQEDVHTAWLMLRILLSTIASAALLPTERASGLRSSRSRRASTRVVPDMAWKAGMVRSRPASAAQARWEATAYAADNAALQFFGMTSDSPMPGAAHRAARNKLQKNTTFAAGPPDAALQRDAPGSAAIP